MVEFNVTIIGSGSAVPMHGRHPSAQVVQYDDAFFLIDCGEGTQLLFKDAGIKPFRIKIIFISHLHGDHVFGLPGLLSSYSHLGRSELLTIYGPIGIKGLLESIIHFTELKIRFPLEIIEVETSGPECIYATDDFEILTFPLRHRIKCQGYLFREKKQTMRFNKDALKTLSLNPEQIRKAIDGQTIVMHGREVLPKDIFLPPLSPMSYAYCSDTAYLPSLASWLKSVNVIYHEATFMNDLKELAKETGHTTAGDAAKIALDAQAGCLVLGHYSSRYKSLAELLEEAKAVFPKTVLSEEGKLYKVREMSEFIPLQSH
jgi:ribonuclease Z